MEGDVLESAGFVPRPKQYAEIQANYEATHSLEAERRRSETIRLVVPWAIAGILGTYALVAGIQNIYRPVPQDRFEIAFVHDDGTYEAPREEKDLTPIQQREVLQSSLMNYITWRAGYTFAASQKAYNIVSAMTAGKEQSRYQKVMLSRDNPESPLIKYGMNAQIVPIDIRFDPYPNGPDSWNFSYTERVLKSGGGGTDTAMRGSITFVRGPVPTAYRVPYDPESVVVLQYETHPVADPVASKRGVP